MKASEPENKDVIPMTTHTPGPFEIDTDRSILCRPQAERYGRDMISDVLPIAGVYSWMGPEEADANARLFGAADQMLAALKLAEIWLLNCLPLRQPTEELPLPVIRAAIAKATGMTAESRSKGLAVETKGSIY